VSGALEAAAHDFTKRDPRCINHRADGHEPKQKNKYKRDLGVSPSDLDEDTRVQSTGPNAIDHSGTSDAYKSEAEQEAQIWGVEPFSGLWAHNVPTMPPIAQIEQV
jgi:hypothetical protein